MLSSKSPAPTAASAPNCAARITASCPSWSSPCREAEYDAWVAEQPAGRHGAAGSDKQRLWTMRRTHEPRRKRLRQSQCATCHQADGNGLAPAFPALAGNTVATGPVEEHIDVSAATARGHRHAGLGRTAQRALDIAAALTYTRNAFGQRYRRLGSAQHHQQNQQGIIA